jgi:wyosine [tRNA(Phe)-imidazoG37] synthetase (radical SAM superfamily)
MMHAIKLWWRRHRLKPGARILGKAWEAAGGIRRRARGLPTADPVQAMRYVRKEDVLSEYASDPWSRNYFLNWWEFYHGVAVLSSYPWNVTIPIADVCNARCTFCTSWLEGTRVLELDEVSHFAEVLPYARLLGIAGHGEPLAHPHCEELFERLGSYLDPRCESYVITNGVFLEKRKQALERLNVTTYNISLNAASSGTHDAVMGLGAEAFADIIASIQRLVAKRDSSVSSIKRPYVNISFVINRDNVHDMADFIRLGNRLGVDNIYLRTLSAVGSAVIGLNYHLLPPYLHPEFEKHTEEAKQAMAESKANIVTDVASWSAPVLSQEMATLVQLQAPPVVERKDALKDHKLREAYTHFYGDVKGTGQPLSEPEGNADTFEDGANPFLREPPFNCHFVYHDFIINDFNLRLIPCCYMSSVPGFELIRFDGKRPFMEYWNSPAFVSLRTRLQQGPLYGACKRCPAQDVRF